MNLLFFPKFCIFVNVLKVKDIDLHMQGRLLEILILDKKINAIEATHYARGAYWLKIDDVAPVKWIKN